MSGAPGEDARRLRWRCRRGMLEVDLLLERFLHEERLESLSQAERAAFERLLALPDATLLEWLLGHARPADPELAHVVDLARQPAPR